VKNHEGFIERRQHKRLTVKDGAFVEIWNHVRKVGQVIDISMGGLAFRYIDIGERPKKSFELGLFTDDKTFLLEKVFFKSVSDIEIHNEFFCSSIKMRRHSVQFDKLTPECSSQLNYFIQHYTSEIEANFA
jgi:hypothetical protein